MLVIRPSAPWSTWISLALLAGSFGCQPATTGDSASEADPEEDAPPQPPIALGTFNTESGGSVPSVVAEAIREVTGESVWGFAEVAYEDAAETYAEAAADDGEYFAHITGTTGNADRLVIAWENDGFELIDSYELDDINIHGTARAPLVARLRDKTTDLEFLFMVNHLWRTDNDARHQQASLLNAWGRDQDLPFISVGDYNFDWSAINGDTNHDAGYDLLTDDDVFVWLRPDPLDKTQCSNYRSVLDFVFVGGEFRDWSGRSKILQMTEAYCDESSERSDHRPVWAELEADD